MDVEVEVAVLWKWRAVEVAAGDDLGTGDGVRAPCARARTSTD